MDLLKQLKELGLNVYLVENEVYDMFLMKLVYVYFIVIEDLDNGNRFKKQISEENYIKLTKE